MDVNGVSRECVKIALDSKFLGYVKVDFESKNRKGFVYSEWYPKADFIKNNPNLAKLVKVSSKQPKDDLGRVSLASLTTLMGIAKPMFWPSVETAVLTPMTWPALLSKGPPEYPGLIAAEV